MLEKSHKDSTLNPDFQAKEQFDDRCHKRKYVGVTMCAIVLSRSSWLVKESTMIYIACKEILARISLTTLIPCKGNASSMNVVSVLHLYNKSIQENNLNNEYMLLIWILCAGILYSTLQLLMSNNELGC